MAKNRRARISVEDLNSSTANESVKDGCRGMAGLKGPRHDGAEVSDDGDCIGMKAEGGRRKQLDGAEVSDEGDCRRRATAVDAALPHVVYTGVRMLEIHPKSPTLSHFLDRPARLAGGTARSAKHCSIMRSDVTRARPGHLNTEWDGCTECATPISGDCTLLQVAQFGPNSPMAGE